MQTKKVQIVTSQHKKEKLVVKAVCSGDMTKVVSLLEKGCGPITSDKANKKILSAFLKYVKAGDLERVDFLRGSYLVDLDNEEDRWEVIHLAESCGHMHLTKVL